MGKGGRGQDALKQRKVAEKKASFTVEEVKKHRTPGDAWLVYQSKVYDVSGWHAHPGGDVVFTHAGDDATDIFNAFHPKSAYAVLDRFYVGELDVAGSKEGFQGPVKTAQQEAFELGYRKLRTELMREGMFEASQLYYVYKCLCQVLLWSASMFLAHHASYSHSWASIVGSGVLLATFLQQCGWLSHDYLHHQVYANRRYGDMFGLFWGNLMQGFSVTWWKTKHNSHHAVPNLHQSHPLASDGDPDIDTMPLLAWSMTMAKHADKNAFARFMVSHQAFLYFPILCVARISWLLQSFFNVFDSLAPQSDLWKDANKQRLSQYPRSEMALLLLHYVWYGYAIYLCTLGQGVLGGVAWFLITNCVCGLFLALVFGLGHNGMSTYDADKRPDFWTLQVTTTRNVTPNWFVDWFCGGLQYQVDHHLFPGIPRHNLPQVHARVVSFCKEFGVTYHEASMWQGTKEVLVHLQGVTTDFLQQFPAM